MVNVDYFWNNSLLICRVDFKGRKKKKKTSRGSPWSNGQRVGSTTGRSAVRISPLLFCVEKKKFVEIVEIAKNRGNRENRSHLDRMDGGCVRA